MIVRVVATEGPEVIGVKSNNRAVKSAKPKFIYIIWGTDKSHKEVKLQTIDNLKASNDKYIKRPIFTDATTKDFTQEVLAYISI